MGTVTSFFSNEEYLYTYINANNLPAILQIIQKHPQLLNKIITQDTQCTALGRAIWRNNYPLAEKLLELGASPQLFSQGLSPLMIAAYRNSPRIVNLLVQHYKVDLQVQAVTTSNDRLNALDYAILYGSYEIAVYLSKQKGMSLGRQSAEYHKIARKQKRGVYYVDYERILEGIRNNTSPEFVVRDLFRKSLISDQDGKKLVDPVLDPNQTWTAFIKRISNFGPPPLVQRSSLPPTLQPQNRILGKVHYYIQKLKGPSSIVLHPPREPAESQQLRRNSNDRQQGGVERGQVLGTDRNILAEEVGEDQNKRDEQPHQKPITIHHPIV